MVTPTQSVDNLIGFLNVQPQNTYNPQRVASHACFAAGMFRPGFDVPRMIQNFNDIIDILRGMDLALSQQFIATFQHMISLATKLQRTQERSFNALTLAR